MGLDKLNPFKHHDKKDKATDDTELAPTKSTSSVRSVKDGLKKIFDADTRPREPTQNADRKFDTDFKTEEGILSNHDLGLPQEKARIL